LEIFEFMPTTRSLLLRCIVSTAALVAGFSVVAPAEAQTVESNPTGAPPPDAKAMVTGPKAKDAPTFDDAHIDTTSATISAGGMQTAGNAKFLAATANGAFDLRRGQNGFGANVLANFGRTAAPGTDNYETTAQNFQGRVRYDRYLSKVTSLFLIGTGRHDKFQGINFRLNIDPGVKYLFIREEKYSLWGEVGYDLQLDKRRQEDVEIAQAAGQTLPPKVDHSSRLFVGYKQAFNKEVTLSTGLEYLQSFVTTERYRLNYEAVFAAKIVGGVAVGLGFTARLDNKPLAGKEKLDTATTLNLIYAFSDAKEAPKPACPVCPEPAPAPKCPEAMPDAGPSPAPASGPAPMSVPGPAAAPTPAPAPAPSPPPSGDATAPAKMP
jgi:putative salt-induced outer membrane protein YdiY